MSADTLVLYKFSKEKKVFGMLFYQFLKRERLILDSEGIRYQSNLPKFIQAFVPYRDWSAKWSEVTATYLKNASLASGTRLITLGIHIGMGYKELLVCQWVDSKNADEFRLRLDKKCESPTQILTILQGCPLIKYLTDKGIQIEVDPKLSLKTHFFQFDPAINSNQHTIIAAILYSILVVYTVLDAMIFQQETYVAQPFYQLYLSCGVSIALLVVGWLIGAKVRKRESVIIALLVAGAFSLALLPGLLRLNQLTDKLGLQSHSYELKSDLSFEPVNDKTLPILYLNDDRYWSYFKTGTFYEFQLRKGGLGFYQISLAHLEQLKASLVKPTFIVKESSQASAYALPKKLLHTLNGHKSNVLPITFSPNGQIIASGSKDKTIKLWAISTGNLLKTFTGHTDKIQSLAFSPDGTLLASSSEDNTIKLWDIKTSELIRTLKSPKNSLSSKMFSVSFSPDGTKLASGNWDKSIILWEVNSGEVLHFIEGHTDYVNSVDFSPDGLTLASGSFDHSIKLWSVATGKLKKTLKGHGDFVLSVSFSPDGKLLASSSYDKTIKLWDVNKNKVLHTLIGHQDAVTSVAFRPDGKILASGSFDKTLKLWEVSTGQFLSTFKGHRDYVNTIVFSPDGRLLASGSGDDTVKIWE
ncbi:MAG: WD40 repeat domain-containing protein [Pseudomonadota bacterium]